jgi:predicted permease
MSLWQDVHFAFRVLLKDRWFTVVAAVALALGIAANNAVFTLVNAVVLRGLPFTDAERIVAVNMRDTRNRQMGVSFADFEDWRRSTRSFSDMALMLQVPQNVSDAGHLPEQYNGPYISANLFKLIGQRPILGRDFTPEEDGPGAPPVLMLGYGIWQTRYAGDPAILGRTITSNNITGRVIGVMGPDMKFPPNSDLWVPLAQTTVIREWGRQVRNFQMIARLAPGVTIPQARDELRTVAARVAQDYPQSNKDLVPDIVSYNEHVGGPQIRLVFWSLMGSVAFVLLIACANVANLLLARASRRAREVTVRVSLGATRWRVVRQLLVESVLLALFSGLLSFPLAMYGIHLFDIATRDVGKPYYMDFSMDGAVYVFFAVVCLGTGVVFGLAPALHLSKTNLTDVLKEGGRSGTGGVGARRWTSALMVVELALTLVLLAGAGFMTRSFLALYSMDLGVETKSLMMAQLALPGAKYRTGDDRAAFIKRVDDRLAGISTIESATTTTNVPAGGGSLRQLSVEGRPPSPGDRPPLVTLLSTGPRYFDVLGVRLLRGRMFTDAEGAPGHESVVVNQRLAAMHFAGEDPIGRRIRLAPDNPGGAPGDAPVSFTIVGVAPSIRQRNAQAFDDDPIVYIPHQTNTDQPRGTTLLVRTHGDPGKIAPILREEIRSMDPDMPVFNIRTLDEFLSRQRWLPGVFGTMFAIFAGIALLLSAVGLYAVTAYSVMQRTQEIGIRVALGAQAGQVVWLILRRAMVHLTIGLTVGMAGALGVGRLLESLLFQTSARDPLTIVSIGGLMIAVSIAACLWPARRATRLDPVSALRYE